MAYPRDMRKQRRDTQRNSISGYWILDIEYWILLLAVEYWILSTGWTHLSASCSCTWGTGRCGTCRNSTARGRRCRSVSVSCPCRRICGRRGKRIHWHRAPGVVGWTGDLQREIGKQVSP